MDESILRFCEQNRQNSRFTEEDFSRYRVKRGLRNEDGTGVVAGLTRICNVHGYVLDEGERSPIDGRLVYRGIDLPDIVQGFMQENRFGFEEVAYLLMCGQLPTQEQLTEFRAALSAQRRLSQEFIQDVILRVPSRSIMNALQRATLALYNYDEDPENQSLPNVMRQSIALAAKMPLIMVAAYEAKLYAFDHSNMHLYVPDPQRSTAENILLTLRTDQQYTDEEAKLLDLLLVIHADHGGGNNSTFTTRVLTSAATDTYSAISAGIGSLKGFRHGGANHKVTEMLADIRSGVHNWEDDAEVERYLEKILDKQAGDGSGLLYGLGHAVYTLSDPRARLLKQFLEKIGPEGDYGREFELIQRVERLAPVVFNRKKGTDVPLCANVDLYSGLAYATLGIPYEVITPLFCVARTVGWCAHRMEELTMPGGKIVRPACKSIQPEGQYVPLAQRT